MKWVFCDPHYVPWVPVLVVIEELSPALSFLLSDHFPQEFFLLVLLIVPSYSSTLYLAGEVLVPPFLAVGRGHLGLRVVGYQVEEVLVWLTKVRGDVFWRVFRVAFEPRPVCDRVCLGQGPLAGYRAHEEAVVGTQETEVEGVERGP